MIKRGVYAAALSVLNNDYSLNIFMTISFVISMHPKLKKTEIVYFKS